MTRGEVAAMLAVAGKVYSRAIGSDMVEVWSEFFGDCTPDEGARAIREHITESSFFPTIADLRKRISSRRVGPVDIGGAWGEVRRTISSVGRYGCPSFSHQAISDAVEALGWITICHTDEDDLPTLRAQFERYYKAALEGQGRAQNYGALEAHDYARTGAMGSGDALKGYLAAVGKKNPGETGEVD